MTRFCGDAIGVRGSRNSSYSSKDLKKNMGELRWGAAWTLGPFLPHSHAQSKTAQHKKGYVCFACAEVFKTSGQHPDIQRAREKARSEAIPVLPEHDANRDFVFMQLSQVGGFIRALPTTLLGI